MVEGRIVAGVEEVEDVRVGEILDTREDVGDLVDVGVSEESV